ncbi:MAG TPA: hypothetical protein VGF76_13465 [Polyangiaceae bacterium]
MPLPALPPEDEPADGDVPPDDEPADDDVPPNDDPADDDMPPNGEPPDDDEPAVETEDEPADVEPEAEPPDDIATSPELSLDVPQATTAGVTASAKAQAIDEIRMNG